MIKKNLRYVGAQDRESLYDIYLPKNWNQKFIIFIHGYKGFKDWGCWNLMALEFYNHGYGFCKFNTSHNGGNLSRPIDFPDLDAFSKNTYSFELHDTNTIIELINGEFKPKQIHVIGHSRGGGIACLAAAQNLNINTLCTLASVDDFESRFPQGQDFKTWKNNGVYSVKNARTNQDMPHLFNFYLDFKDNQKQLDILDNLSRMKKPSLHIHGSEDKAVSLDSSVKLSSVTKGELYIIDNTGHTFDTKHPWVQEQLPGKFQKAIIKILSFYK